MERKASAENLLKQKYYFLCLQTNLILQTHAHQLISGLLFVTLPGNAGEKTSRAIASPNTVRIHSLVFVSLWIQL